MIYKSYSRKGFRSYGINCKKIYNRKPIVSIQVGCYFYQMYPPIKSQSIVIFDYFYINAADREL